jgi:hypothetical protein
MINKIKILILKGETRFDILRYVIICFDVGYLKLTFKASYGIPFNHYLITTEITLQFIRNIQLAGILA